MSRRTVTLLVAGAIVFTAVNAWVVFGMHADRASAPVTTGATEPDAATSPVADDEIPATTPGPASADTRDQYALFDAIRHAKSLATEDERGAEMSRVRADWSNHRVHWEMFRVVLLCNRAVDCHLVPFDQAIRPEAGLEGFMPKLVMTDDEFGRLRELCEGKEHCAITFDATVTDLGLDVDIPTHLILGDVHIVSARENTITAP